MNFLNGLRHIKHRSTAIVRESTTRRKLFRGLRPLHTTPLVEIPIFCISLKRKKWRRGMIVRQMKRLGFRTWSIFDAVDGCNLDRRELESIGTYDGDSIRQRFRSDLSMGNIGCYLSHVALWRRVADDRLPVALVCEDDVIFSADRLDRIDLSLLPHNWDIVFLHALVATAPPSGHVHQDVYTIQSYGGSTAAYLLSQSGARKLLDRAMPIRSAIDGFVGARMRDEISVGDQVEYRAFLIWPPCAWNGSLDGAYTSTI